MAKVNRYELKVKKFSSVEKVLVLNYIFSDEGVPNVLTIVLILMSQILKSQNNYLNSYIFVGITQ